MKTQDKEIATRAGQSRRTFLLQSSIAAAGWLLADRTVLAAAPQLIVIENFSDAGFSQGTVQTQRIQKTQNEWRRLLSQREFSIAREAGTEIPYTGRYWRTKDNGLYRCVCCNNALFDSQTKFESGTGWPSFWQPISKYNVLERNDLSHGMRRVEAVCNLCDAHLGHVFNDGPQPTGLRYCLNSVSLRFTARA